MYLTIKLARTFERFGFSRNLVKRREKKFSKKADEVIEFLEISSLADELAGNLSGGQKKLLELGRTMMVEPK